MPTTIPRAVSGREVSKPEDLSAWANKEVMPVLRDLRAASNYEAVIKKELDTAGTAVFTNIWTSESMPTDSTWLTEVRITGTSATQHCAYVLRGVFGNTAGAVAQVGTTSIEYAEESAAGLDVQLVVSGQTVTLDVKDDGAGTFVWVAVIRVL